MDAQEAATKRATSGSLAARTATVGRPQGRANVLASGPSTCCTLRPLATLGFQMADLFSLLLLLLFWLLFVLHLASVSPCWPAPKGLRAGAASKAAKTTASPRLTNKLF